MVYQRQEGLSAQLLGSVVPPESRSLAKAVILWPLALWLRVVWKRYATPTPHWALTTKLFRLG